MKNKNVSRRDFVKTLGVVGMASAVGAGRSLAQPGPAPATSVPAPLKPQQIATRPFGRTGVNVSMLGLGGIFDITSNQLVLKQALAWGVTYWDTAAGYNNGRSEEGIGMFLGKNPEARKEIFLVTKYDGGGLDDALNQSLEKLKTDYVDMYFMHGEMPGPETKAWAEKMKAAQKIRFFGFSTHSNMENDLQAAARLGWIDGIMLKYDYRLAQNDAMKAAVDAATGAGIGLTAMKTQGGDSIRTETEADLKMGGHFLQRGFTQQQAKLKAVWENSRIACICSQMANATVLHANVAAALDKTSLTAEDHAVLREYAQATASRHCAGCTRFCENVPGHQAPIGDVMRALMYHRSYGDAERARAAFARIPEADRSALAGFDYSAAERVCPNRMPIARLMREAGELFS